MISLYYIILNKRTARKYGKNGDDERITFKLNCKIFQNGVRLTKFTNYKITHKNARLWSILSLSLTHIEAHTVHAKGIIFRNGFSSRWKAPTFQELLKIVSKSIIEKIRTSNEKKIRAKNSEKSSLERASRRQGNRSYKLNIIKIVFFCVFH